MLTQKEMDILKKIAGDNLLSTDVIKQVHQKAMNENVSLHQVLLDEPSLSPSQIAQVYSKVLGIPYESLSELDIEEEVIQKLTAKFAKHHNLIPLVKEGNKIKVCVSNPLDLHMLDDLESVLFEQVELSVGPHDEIEKAIKSYYGLGAETVQSLSQASAEHKATPSANAIDLQQEDGSSIVRFVNQMLSEAKKMRATDIHIEPFEDEMKVRYRIDGILQSIKLPPSIKNLQASILTRIKVMANMDISEQRLPQDGRMKVISDQQELDLRVSVLPTPYGESLNIRILSSQVLLKLDSLGLNDKNLKILKEAIIKPHGIILLTGPTGSGKTTTLYSALNYVNDGRKKIITIEDPIEYQIKGITQIQVHPKIGLTFSSGLRSMLRHDPDIMMVGEIRDSETAEIAMRVALTGHLVFSTLHTNDAPGAVARLIDMGVEPFLVASSLECVIAQRLIRRVCPHCRQEDTQKYEILEESLVWRKLGPFPFYKAAGCKQCHGTGYHGRMAIHEVFQITDEARSMIARGGDVQDIYEFSEKGGMLSLREDAFLKLREGSTTFEEIIRVTQSEA